MGSMRQRSSYEPVGRIELLGQISAESASTSTIRIRTRRAATLKEMPHGTARRFCRFDYAKSTGWICGRRGGALVGTAFTQRRVRARSVVNPGRETITAASGIVLRECQYESARRGVIFIGPFSIRGHPQHQSHLCWLYAPCKDTSAHKRPRPCAETPPPIRAHPEQERVRRRRCNREKRGCIECTRVVPWSSRRPNQPAAQGHNCPVSSCVSGRKL
jgi:hypothetical protein